MRKHEETKHEMRARTAKNKKRGKKVKGKIKAAPMTYEEAVNKIPIGAWISRLGEECSELAAAISKYERAVNGDFPCRTSDADAFKDVISEAVDVALALEYCTEHAFTLGDNHMLSYQKALIEKKAKIVRQVTEAMQCVGTKDFKDSKIAELQLSFYRQMLPHVVYGAMGMAPDPNNPMRDAMIEDLYDD